MNLFRREMKSGTKALIFWCAGIVLLIAAGMGKYAGFSGSGDEPMTAMLALYPAPLRALFGIGLYDLSDALGFYGVLFLFVLLIAGIHAVMLGANVLAKEERDKTAEFLLAKPCSRLQILGAKACAALVQIALVNLVTLACSYGMLAMYKPASSFAGSLCAMAAGMLCLQVLFFAVGQAVASTVRRAERAVSLSSMVLMGAFIATVIAGLNTNLAFLDWISPFGLFSAKHTLVDAGLPIWSFLIAGGAAAACMAAALVCYPKRDIAA